MSEDDPPKRRWTGKPKSGAGGERRAHHVRVARIHRDREIAQFRDHRQDARQLLGFAHGRRAGVYCLRNVMTAR